LNEILNLRSFAMKISLKQCTIVLSLIAFFLFASILQSKAQDARLTHLKWMEKSLPDVPEWSAWQEKTGELPPDFEKLPRSNLLPDPFRFLSGSPVKNNAADWAARRVEIRQLFEKYVTGTFPPKPAIDSIVVLDETSSNGYLTRNVRVEFGPQGKGSVRIRVVMPETKDKKYPVLIGTSLSGPGQTLIRRGYISAGFAGNDFMDDAASLKDLYPDYDFAALPRRAWLTGIVIDYLETIPHVDKERIAIYGYSRDGKMAVFAAGIDQRISAVIAGSTGVGGVVPWRLAGERGGGESIETTTRMFPSWFVPRLRFFSGQEDRLPVDANLLLALIAPRAALMEWGLNDQVANGWAMEQAWQSAQKVYERLGQPDRLGLLHVPGFHGGNDMEACIDWLDWQFGRTQNKWENDFVFPWNFEKWEASAEEKVDIDKFPKHKPSEQISKSLEEWNGKAPKLLNSVKWMLGENPPKLATSPGNMPGPRQPAPGPTVIALGKNGNPGQLSPDVPAWVIAAGGQEYGWLAPEKNQVESRRIRFGTSITGDLYYPAGTPAGTKLPTVIWLHGYNYPLGYMWVYRRDLHPVLALANAGYAVLAYDQTGFGMRWNEAELFYDRFPHWSRLGKMVEDLQDAVDALQKDPLIDADNISVFGYTLGATIGLYGAALDERISGVVSVCGFTPMRSDSEDTGTSGMTRYSHLYGLLPRLGLFAGNESRLPYDYEEIIALIAPRKVLIVQPTMDRDANPGEVLESFKKAGSVYSLKGAKENLEIFQPEDYARLTKKTQDNILSWMQNNIQNQNKTQR